MTVRIRRDPSSTKMQNTGGLASPTASCSPAEEGWQWGGGEGATDLMPCSF